MCSYTERLKELRKEAGLSQEELAKKIYISQSCMSKYESGKSFMPTSRAIALAKYYDVCLDYLIGLTDEKRSFGSYNKKL